MNTDVLDKTEDFLNERNGVYEENAKPSEEPAPAEICAEGANNSQIMIKHRKKAPIGLFLLCLVLVGGIAGFMLCRLSGELISQRELTDFLTLRIKGGFFSNAVSSFFGCMVWIAAAFVCGLCAVGQPLVFLLPLFKGIGAGVTLSGLISLYGGNGIACFAAFVLPGTAMGTVLCVYECRCAVSASNRLLKYIRGARLQGESREYFSLYFMRFAVCSAGCFISGIIDAGISLLLSGLFVI